MVITRHHGTCGQCGVVLGTPHQRPDLYYITCIDHSCHTFTDAEESNVVHLVTVRWAFLFQIFRAEQIVQARQQTEYLLMPANIGLPPVSDIMTCSMVITWHSHNS